MMTVHGRERQRGVPPNRAGDCPSQAGLERERSVFLRSLLGGAGARARRDDPAVRSRDMVIAVLIVVAVVVLGGGGAVLWRFELQCAAEIQTVSSPVGRRATTLSCIGRG